MFSFVVLKDFEFTNIKSKRMCSEGIAEMYIEKREMYGRYLHAQHYRRTMLHQGQGILCQSGRGEG